MLKKLIRIHPDFAHQAINLGIESGQVYEVLNEQFSLPNGNVCSTKFGDWVEVSPTCRSTEKLYIIGAKPVTRRILGNGEVSTGFRVDMEKVEEVGAELEGMDYADLEAKTIGEKLKHLDYAAIEVRMTRKEIIEVSKCFGKQEDGSHYTDMQLQPLEATYLRYGLQGLKAAIHTKVDKYISRKKDNEVIQLKKAQHCLSILAEITELEAQ